MSRSQQLRRMTATIQLVSPRLVLREWQERDRSPFATMNADPVVRRYFPAPFTLEESNEAFERYNRQLEHDDFTMFAVEDRLNGEFLGVVGAQIMRFAGPRIRYRRRNSRSRSPSSTGRYQRGRRHHHTSQLVFTKGHAKAWNATSP